MSIKFKLRIAIGAETNSLIHSHKNGAVDTGSNKKKHHTMN